MTSIDRLLELEKLIANTKLTNIDGFAGFRLLASGELLICDGRETFKVDPSVDQRWKPEAERLALEQEFRSLFGSISDADFQEYLSRVNQ
jgi:hypothetical protein